MRILIIDFAYKNINKTVMLWKLAWCQIGDVTFFGPGHVSDDTWRLGLKAFIKAHGTFDVIVAAELLVSSLSESITLDHVKKSVYLTYECPFDVSSAIDGCRKVFDEFIETESVQILSMLEFDAYNMRDAHYDRLCRHDFYIIGWGEDFIRPRTVLETAKESFGDRANDNWWNFVTKNRHRLISSPAMIAESEFHWAGLEYRKDQCAVQGARYYARQQVRKKLSNAGIPWIGKSLVDSISIINRVNPAMLRWPSVRNFLNERWEKGFHSSKYAFTCGSALRLPIRKYFEIPAYGCVLMAEPSNGFDCLGFKNWENTIKVEPETILEVVNWLGKNSEDAQRIASAGRNLIWNKHRLGARVKQYKLALDAIIDNTFNGSRWVKGEFEIIRKF